VSELHPFDRLGIHVLDRMIRGVSGLASLFVVAHGKAVNAVLARIVCKTVIVLLEGG
jgi:hypothetical protein